MNQKKDEYTHTKIGQWSALEHFCFIFSNVVLNCTSSPPHQRWQTDVEIPQSSKSQHWCVIH